MVSILKDFCPDFETLYARIVANPDYAHLTREELENIYQNAIEMKR